MNVNRRPRKVALGNFEKLLIRRNHRLEPQIYGKKEKPLEQRPLRPPRLIPLALSRSRPPPLSLSLAHMRIYCL